MVKSTFTNLPTAKRQKIEAVLLEEFSTYPLAQAKVSHIVKKADIARGAFYKYFDDLTDAYLYMYHIAIETIHTNMSPDEKFDPDHFYDRVVKFIDETQYSKFEPMIKLHMAQNKYLIPDNFKIYSRQLLNMSPEIWSAMVLSHEVINLCLSDPKNKEKNLARYKKSLGIIAKGMDQLFLAIKEIKHEKLRYGLIILMIFLISYLIFMLSSLSVGLASENTQAIGSWDAQKVILNKNSNVSMFQSILTKKDVKNANVGKDEAYVGQLGIVVKEKNRETVSAQFLGVKKNQFIYQDQKLVSGKKATKNNQVTVDSSFRDKGYKLGDKISLNGSSKKYKIVGFVQNAKINIAPIVYGSLTTWKKMRMAAPNVVASAIISRDSSYKYNHKNAKTYPIAKFINKLPGYTAQNTTFELMIGFLFVISLIIVAVFLYILTMQKMHNFAVMRAQGIPSKTLVGATIIQSIILVAIGVIIGLILMWITNAALPAAVPISFTPMIMVGGTVGMLVMGIIGSLIPIRSILKVDPAKAIGE